jgi:hypothetical protein
MAQVWRTTGAWGTAFGADLSPTQIDNNFWELQLQINAITASPPAARSIASITITLDQITFHMSDASLEGPFTIPTAIPADIGNWVALTAMSRFKFFHNGGSTYLSLRTHTTAATFDPNRTDGPGLEYYSLIMAAPAQPYDVKPPVDGSLMVQPLVVRQFWVPADFAGSSAYLDIATTVQTLVFALWQNAVQIGTITFTPGVGTVGGGGQYGTFAGIGGSPKQFQPTQRIRLVAPTLTPAVQDATANRLSVTLLGTTGLA